MGRLSLVEGLLLNLAGEIEADLREYLPADVALEKLKTLTGQDFGYDVDKWREWFDKHPYQPAGRRTRV